MNWNSTNNELFRLLEAIHLGGKRWGLETFIRSIVSRAESRTKRQEERDEKKDRKTEGKFCVVCVECASSINRHYIPVDSYSRYTVHCLCKQTTVD